MVEKNLAFTNESFTREKGSQVLGLKEPRILQFPRGKTLVGRFLSWDILTSKKILLII